MKKPKPVFRILIVEDDPDRAETLQDWLPRDVRPVVVTSAGKAMGLLARDKGHVYAGILLDHDLQQQTAIEKDLYLSGEQVVESAIRNVYKDVPILVHSVNAQQASVMVSKLEAAGFDVTRMSMDHLKKEQLLEWVEEAREMWEDRDGI